MGEAPRYASATLGLWLIISAYLWPHHEAQLANAWAVGLICICASLASSLLPRLRFLNAALALWLLASSFALPNLSTVTLLTSVAVAAAVLVLSLAGSNLPA
jgi:hypothetical protein